jgi:TolB-like protein
MTLLCLAVHGAAESKRLPRIAVLPITGEGVDSTTLHLTTDALSDELARTARLQVMDRFQMESILERCDCQRLSTCAKNRSAVQIGQLLSIDHVVVGSMTRMRGSWFLSMRAVDVGTGEILGSSSKIQRGGIDDVVDSLFPIVAKELAFSLDDPGRDAIELIAPETHRGPSPLVPPAHDVPMNRHPKLRWAGRAALIAGMVAGIFEHLAFHTASRDADAAYDRFRSGADASQDGLENTATYREYKRKGEKARQAGFNAKIGYGIAALGLASFCLSYAF